MKEIEKGNIIFFASILVVILACILFAFYTYYLNEDYLIFSDIPCDPVTEQCFVGWCDPEYEECTGTDEDAYYYKIIQKSARNLPLCDPLNSSCIFSCEVDEDGCAHVLCEPGGESECSNLETYEF